MNGRLYNHLENIILSEVHFKCGYEIGDYSNWTTEKGKKVRKNIYLSDKELVNTLDCSKIQFCHYPELNNDEKYKLFFKACNQINLDKDTCEKEYRKINFDNLLKKIALYNKAIPEYNRCIIRRSNKNVY